MTLLLNAAHWLWLWLWLRVHADGLAVVVEKVIDESFTNLLTPAFCAHDILHQH